MLQNQVFTTNPLKAQNIEKNTRLLLLMSNLNMNILHILHSHRYEYTRSLNFTTLNFTTDKY